MKIFVLAAMLCIVFLRAPAHAFEDSVYILGEELHLGTVSYCKSEYDARRIANYKHPEQFRYAWDNFLTAVLNRTCYIADNEVFTPLRVLSGYSYNEEVPKVIEIEISRVPGSRLYLITALGVR